MDAIYSKLSSYYKRFITLADYHEDTRWLEEVSVMLDLIFVGVTVATLFLCFF